MNKVARDLPARFLVVAGGGSECLLLRSRRDRRGVGGDLAWEFCSSVSSTSRRRLLQRRREAGGGVSGAGRRCGVGVVREVARLKLGWWFVAVGSIGLRRWRRSGASGPGSKGCGDFPRPMTHSDKCTVICGGACSEARNAAWLLWHLFGAWLVGCPSSSSPAGASATAEAGIDGRVAGGCRDPEGFFAFFLVLGFFL